MKRGVLNVGYWGMPVRANTEYKGSFYAKAGAGDIGPITVSLVGDQSGKAVATASVAGIGTDWKQYPFTLKTGAVTTSAANHLTLTVAHAGTLWLNLVSLFPPTYHNRPNGFRVDLMEKMAAMHPTFLRFPGGNYLEGNHISERFDWKKTIGPLVDRPTHPGPWGYHSSDGMGLLEFLGWCEDLKMAPVLAVYAGYSLAGEHVDPGADLEPYVQDALDEIEYVSGGTDTKWGAVRARDGHPEPFKLTYVEIGNEEWFDKSGSYDERYTQFSKAIKAKYPGLQLIATAPVKSAKPDVVDEHYYVRATQNFHDAAHYDTPGGSPAAPLHWEGGHYDQADRNGPKIFVGEWATREGIADTEYGSRAWRRGVDDGHGAQQRPGRDVRVRPAAGERESRRHAVGDRPDRLRHAQELRVAGLLCAGDVRRRISGITPWDRSSKARGRSSFTPSPAMPRRNASISSS